MGVIGRARGLLAAGPVHAARRVGAFAARRARAVWDERRDRGGTFAPLPASMPPELPYRYFALPAIDTLRGAAERIGALAELHRGHRFDLLGSGWVRVEHGMRCAGVEGHVYPSGPPVDADGEGEWLRGRIDPGSLEESRRIWRMVDAGYPPVDWQLDFKSGHRWGESTWHGRIRYGDHPGVDVKVPWELARMQHLPQLAWAHALARAGEPGFSPAEAYAREFRNQVLDFIATNPPRFGRELDHGHGRGDPRGELGGGVRPVPRGRCGASTRRFRAELARSVYAHGAYLVRHLEWNGGARGNHYLADVAGLLFAAAYLPRTAETDAWLAFAVQELVGETEHQFTPDGAVLRGVHRLPPPVRGDGGVRHRAGAGAGGGEARRAGGVRRRAAPRPPPASPRADSAAPASRRRRIVAVRPGARGADAADGGVHPRPDEAGRPRAPGGGQRQRPLPQAVGGAPGRPRGGRAAPAGEPGRVWTGCRTAPSTGKRTCWTTGTWWRRSTGCSDAADFAAFAPGHPEREIVRALAGGARFAAAAREGSAAAGARVGTEAEWARVRAAMEAPGMRTRAWTVPLPPGAGAPECCAYPWFGVYILRFAGFYLAVRCGGRGQDETSAHAHSDQLAVEVEAEGADPVRDPGTYLYTPLPERRNEYRSARAHHAPLGGEGEPAPLDRGLFQLGQMVRGECLYFGPRGFAGRYRGWGEPVYRMVEVLDGEVRVTDAGRTLESAPEPPPFSPAYGVRHA